MVSSGVIEGKSFWCINLQCSIVVFDRTFHIVALFPEHTILVSDAQTILDGCPQSRRSIAGNNFQGRPVTINSVFEVAAPFALNPLMIGKPQVVLNDSRFFGEIL